MLKFLKQYPFLLLPLLVYTPSGVVLAASPAPSASAPVPLSVSIPGYVHVNAEPNTCAFSINPLAPVSETCSIGGAVTTNYANPNAGGVEILVENAATLRNLFASPSNGHRIKVFFSGTIGGVNIAEGLPFAPLFSNGEAAIDLTASIGNTNSAFQGSTPISWLQMPPGVYTGVYTITATAGQ